jgi:UDP-glucose 4-epimerase
VPNSAPGEGRHGRAARLQSQAVTGGLYLVTGGSGFIGSHLVNALLARGDEVVALDDLSTGRLSNLSSAEANPGFRFVQGSILDELMVDELVHECDTVIHLAAAVGVKLIVEQPLRSLITNLRGSEIVIGACHRYRRKVLLASTSEIYGKNGEGPLSENSDRILGSPNSPRWAYSTAKAVDETLALAYHRERDLPAVIVRLFNTVGPRQSPAYGMVIPRFIRQALAGAPLTIFGDGTQRRCFCHVSDVVRALLLLIEHPEAVGEAFNIGAVEEISVRELAERIIACTGTGSASTLEYIPYADAYGVGIEDMYRRLPDISKLRSLTGWRPTMGLDEILTETIADAVQEARAGQLATTRAAGARPD